MAIVIVIVGGLGFNGIAVAFCKGLNEVAFVAIIVGLSRLISLLMEQANIIDTVVFSTPLSR
jgi:uncharacterized ion transporter superfamily protein YfcC